MSEPEPLFLDEEDELYGYGILNVHRNTFVAPLGGGPMGADSDIFGDKEAVLEYYEEVEQDLDSVDHLRIVRVHLDNDVDKEAMSRTE